MIPMARASTSSTNGGRSTQSTSDLPTGIGRPATSTLAVVGITRLQQLAKVSEQEVLALHGVGPKAIRILKETLAARGLAFADKTGRDKARRA
jgi:predicted flap endonuclease-1-like 5' DNA nuclease